MFVYLIIKVFKCSPVPASFFPYLLTSLHWCQNPGRGGVAAIREGAEESAPFASGPEPAAIRQVGGGAGNGGLAAGCPRLEEPSPSARRRRSVKLSTKDVQYHRMAPRVRAAQLVEDRAAVCPGTGPRCFFFFFSPLSSLSVLILLSPFLSPRLSLPPGTLGTPVTYITYCKKGHNMSPLILYPKAFVGYDSFKTPPVWRN